MRYILYTFLAATVFFIGCYVRIPLVSTEKNTEETPQITQEVSPDEEGVDEYGRPKDKKKENRRLFRRR